MPLKKQHIENRNNENTVATLDIMLKAKPFLKWVGGKGQLLETFRGLYPEGLLNGKIKNYYEPFMGGGAVFFDIMQQHPVENAFLYDINEELVLTYRVIQRDVAKLTSILYEYEKAYRKRNKSEQAAYYYEQRTQFNQQRNSINYGTYSDRWLARAAQLIFLNKTCFNGLYRVNSKGAFNTPAGEYTNPTICDENNLLAASKVLEAATIQLADFRQVKKDLRPGSFVYFDPPYRPISRTASFTAYSRQSFADEDQKALKELFVHIDNKGERVMLSNSDPRNADPNDNFFDELYKDFNILRIPAKRMINSNAAKRGNINEIVVTNYPTAANP